VTPSDIGYLAAMLDGEGSVGSSCSPGNRGRRRGTPQYLVRISVTNTDRPMLEWLKQVFPLGQIRQKSDKGRLGTKPCFEWVVGSQEAAWLLGVVLPVMRIKRDQASLCLALASLSRPPGAGRTRRLTSIELEQRSVLHRRISELNGKGPVN
jgi:hypothetical protein